MTVYVGFEIEVEDDKKYYNKRDRSVYKLLDLSSPITKITASDKIQPYHKDTYKSLLGKWRVEADESLQFGAEFIMPPLEKNVGLKTLEDFFSLIEKSGCITSDRCGLHLNISGNNKTLNNANIGYFLSNINFRLLSKLWPLRVNKYNVYCKGISKILKSIAENKNVYPEHYINITPKSLQKQLLKGHSYAINMRVPETTNSRFEIRTMGGENYHKEIEKIKATTNMFAKLLEKSENIEPEHINKRIISYINRVNRKCDSLNNVWLPMWLPTSEHTNITFEKLKENLKSIKNIHKQEFISFCSQLSALYMYDNKPSPSKFLKTNYKNFDNYCSIILSSIKKSLLSSYIDNSNIFEAIKLVNIAIYHIIKYVDCNTKYINYNTNNIDMFCNTLVKNYMTKKCDICGMFIKLTIPDEEQQKDIIWLSKYMYLFDVETRQSYVDRLSNSTLKFINKYKKKYGKCIIRMVQKKLNNLQI